MGPWPFHPHPEQLEGYEVPVPGDPVLRWIKGIVGAWATEYLWYLLWLIPGGVSYAVLEAVDVSDYPCSVQLCFRPGEAAPRQEPKAHSLWGGRRFARIGEGDVRLSMVREDGQPIRIRLVCMTRMPSWWSESGRLLF